MIDLEQHPDFQAAIRARTAPRRFIGHSLLRVFFVPCLLIAVISTWFGHAESGRTLSGALGETVAFSFALPLTMIVVWVAEQIYPANSAWNARPFSNGMRGVSALFRDGVYLFGVTALTAWLLSESDLHLRPLMSQGFAISLWPTFLPLFWRIVLAFLLVEFASYWVHRASHHFQLLWQFHSTHHAITELNGLKALRTHPVDNLVFHVFRIAPLLLLGAGLDESVAAMSLGAILGVLSHANLDLSDRHFGYFFNLPRAHAAHHSATRSESQSNFGCHTVIWDRLFKTHRVEAAQPLQLGILPAQPRTLWQELVWPFYHSVNPSPEKPT